MRTLFAAWSLGTLVALGGCAAMHELSNDVSTYSQWPAERKPSTYAFERLPSQMANAEGQQILEDSARRSLESAGFVPASDPKSADYVVQVGARLSVSERSLYDDPFWWHGGLYHPRYFGHFRRGYGYGFAGYGMFSPIYEREVAILIRDRKTGTPLYEARATNDGYSSSMNSLLSAMFEAAMKDFPNSGINPRRVVTQING
ncbi:MAG TPA: DUF4136 domain-containing protein [Albitalea sp.]|nr:DUF4136 domain-containing protein [Albitalea sp.]